MTTHTQSREQRLDLDRCILGYLTEINSRSDSELRYLTARKISNVVDSPIELVRASLRRLRRAGKVRMRSEGWTRGVRQTD